MKQEKNAFFNSLKTLFKRMLNGRIYFSNEYVGKILLMEDGNNFQVLRNLIVENEQRLQKELAVFIVRFKLSALSLVINKRLSMMPTPFLLAKSGFCEKIWTVSEDGYFQGIYQWASEEFAETYPQSFIFKVMTKRSAEGTLSYEVILDTLLSSYVKKLIK